MTDIISNGAKFSEVKQEKLVVKSSMLEGQRIWIGVSDSVSHKGDTSVVEALTKTVGGVFLDLSKKEESLEAKNFIKAHGSKVEVIGAGNVGISVFNEFAEISKSTQFFLAIDRFYETKLPEGVVINIFAPQSQVEMFIKNNPKTKIVGHYCDIVASPSAEDIKKASKKFSDENDSVVKGLENFWNTKDGKVFFLGGRVQLPDGSWKNNDVETFKKTATDIINESKGQDLLILSHGLRSFTDSVDGKNLPNGKYMNEFESELISKVSNNQKIYISTKNKENAAILRVIEKSKVTDFAIVGNSYHYALQMAVETKKFVEYTSEQMNLPSEFGAMGGNLKMTRPYFWSLSTENIDKIVSERQKNIEKQGALVSASDIFEGVIKPVERQHKKTWEDKEKERKVSSLRETSLISEI